MQTSFWGKPSHVFLPLLIWVGHELSQIVCVLIRALQVAKEDLSYQLDLSIRRASDAIGKH